MTKRIWRGMRLSGGSLSLTPIGLAVNSGNGVCYPNKVSG